MGACSKEILRLYKEGKISESTIIKMAAFKEELEKVSFPGKTPKLPLSPKTLAAILLTGAAFGLGGIAGQAAVDKVVTKLDEKNIEPLFKEMIRMHPELKLEDKKKVKNYFDTVWHFAPHLAKNPFAAGAYIRQAILLDSATGGPDITQTENLANIQRLHTQGKGKADSLGSIVFKPVASSSENFSIETEDIFPQTIGQSL